MGALQSGVPPGDVYSDSPPIFLGRGTILKNTHLVLFSLVHKYLIFIALERCRLMLLLAIPMAVALLQWTGVLGCGWPRSLSMSQKIIPSSQFKNNAPNSASAADATTKRRIEHSV